MPFKKLSAAATTPKRTEELPWKPGDIVVHGTDGICRITDVKALDLIGEGSKDYYVLVPLYNRTLTIYVETKDADDTIRQPMEAREIAQMINSIPDMDQQWIADEKERQRFFQEKLREPMVEDLIPVVRMLYRRKQEMTRLGKKFRSADEQILTRAETIINRELAHGLGIDPEKVPEYIKNYIEK